VKGGTTDKTPGTGLGLSLTKRLVEMHGGKIWVESEGQGKGSRFGFVLPIKPVHLEEGKPETEIARSMIGIESEEIFLNHLNRTISLSKRHNRPFTLCHCHPDMEQLKEKSQGIKEVLEKEMRTYDFLGTDKHGHIYLILQETDRNGAKIVCDRFVKKLESILEGREVSYSMATFPEDGESSEALLRKVSISED